MPTFPPHKDYESLDGWVSAAVLRSIAAGEQDTVMLRAQAEGFDEQQAAKRGFQATVAILRVLRPKNRLGNRTDLSFVLNYSAPPTFLETYKERSKEAFLKLLRRLEGAGYVRNVGGEWFLTAQGGIWLLLAESSPCGWCLVEDLPDHLDLQWWPYSEISEALSRSSAHMRRLREQSPVRDGDRSARKGDILRLHPEFPPLGGSVKVWR